MSELVTDPAVVLEILDVKTQLNDSHNKAYDSALTKPFAQVMEAVAAPLNEHIYGPITQFNKTLGLVVANATLTLPRFAERFIGNRYIKNMEQGQRKKAFGNLLGKLSLKLTDGIDGPVTRALGITSKGGAGLDGLADMAGTYDDGRCIQTVYRQQGMTDRTTEGLLRARTANDVAAMFLGGICVTASAAYAEKQGATVPDRDKPGANAPAKAKFVLSSAGNAIDLLAPLSQSTRNRKLAKVAGGTFLAASVAAGIASLAQYGQSTWRNIQLGRAAKHNSNPQPITL